jgi:FkbM family methyltransferase
MQSHNYMAFVGSAHALKCAVRDLATVARALALVPGRTVAIQAGGCLGVYPAYLSKHFASVVTFEAHQTNYEKMRENIGATNVEMHHKALGAAPGKTGTKQQRRRKTTAPAHEGIAYVTGVGSVDVVRLDDFEFPVCDFLCLDLEGYELEALKGGVQLLAQCRPVLMVEINENCRDYGIREDDVRQWLDVAGYVFQFRQHSDEVYVPKERV